MRTPKFTEATLTSERSMKRLETSNKMMRESQGDVACQTCAAGYAVNKGLIHMESSTFRSVDGLRALAEFQ